MIIFLPFIVTDLKNKTESRKFTTSRARGPVGLRQEGRAELPEQKINIDEEFLFWFSGGGGASHAHTPPACGARVTPPSLGRGVTRPNKPWFIRATVRVVHNTYGSVCCVVINYKMSENEIGNRGSKLANRALFLSRLTAIKEQRIDGSWLLII